MRGQNKQRGVVLITVMLIFIIAGFIAVEIQDQQFYAHQLTRHTITQDQAMAYLKGAEALAKVVLFEDQKAEEQDNSERIDYEDEVWTTVQSFPIDGGLIEGRLLDMQGRFNLSDMLDNESAKKVFEILLDKLGIPSDPQYTAEDVSNAIVDWFDENQDQSGLDDTEDYYYLGLDPPYRTGGQPFVHLSELNLIKGLSKEDLKLLIPYVVVLPKGVPINVNFIDNVLAAALNEVDGESLATNRPDEGYTVSELGSLTDDQKPKIHYTNFSQFYELRIQVELDDQVVRMRSFLFRPKKIAKDSPVRVFGRDTGNLLLSS